MSSSASGWSHADRCNAAAAHVIQVERARATPLDLRGLTGGGLLGGRPVRRLSELRALADRDRRELREAAELRRRRQESVAVGAGSGAGSGGGLDLHSACPLDSGGSSSSLDGRGGGSEVLDDADLALVRELAAVDLSPSAHVSVEHTAEHPCMSPQRRRSSRRKRWMSSTGRAVQSAMNPLDTHECMLRDAAVQLELRRWWKRICLAALVDPDDDTKSVRFRVWVVFLRRLSEILPDWDSEDCHLLPGKNPKKLHFTQQEFGAFLFHDILAPRVNFERRRSSAYVKLGTQLFTKIFEEGSDEENGSGPVDPSDYWKINTDLSPDYRRQRGGGGGSGSNRSGTYRRIKTGVGTNSVPKPPAFARLNKSSRFAKRHSQPTSLTSQNGINGGFISSGEQNSSPANAAELSLAIKHEAECDRLAEMYVLLCPLADLCVLEQLCTRLNFVAAARQDALDAQKKHPRRGARAAAHRLGVELTRTDKMDAERALCMWVSSPVARAWAKEAASRLLGQQGSNDGASGGQGFLRTSHGLRTQQHSSLAAGSRLGVTNSSAATKQTNCQQETPFSRALATEQLRRLNARGQKATRNDCFKWALRCCRVFMECVRPLYDAQQNKNNGERKKEKTTSLKIN